MYRYMLACFDTCFKTTDLYRYKHEFVSIQNRKNRLYVYFFIHSYINKTKPLLPHTVSLLNPHPKFSISLKTQPKFTKFGPKPLQILCSFTFLHQYCGSSIQNLHIQDKGFQFGCVGFFILSTLNKVTLLYSSL
jgi:hypothetical protein